MGLTFLWASFAEWAFCCICYVWGMLLWVRQGPLSSNATMNKESMSLYNFILHHFWMGCVPEDGDLSGAPVCFQLLWLKKIILIKRKLGKKGFVWLMLLGHNPSLRKEKHQDRSREAGTMEEWCLQDCSISSYLASFCIQPKDHLPRAGPAQGEPDPPLLIISFS